MSQRQSAAFVAIFADRETTRMTVSASRKLDLARGVKLARAAYESRMKRAASSIVEAYFERDGEALEHYTREQLDAVP